MKNIVYILSNIDKSFEFEWTAESINPSQFRLHFILLNPGHSKIEEFLANQGHSFRRITYRGKKDLPLAFIRIFFYLFFKRPSAVHCHLFDANLIGLTAAFFAGIRQRIYTRHHSNLNKIYYPNIVKFDRLSNFLATDIVSITNNVSDYLKSKENVPAKKIKLIYHGFKLSELQSAKPESIAAVKQKWGIPHQHPVVGVISRYIHLKGIQYIIPAFQQLRAEFPEAVLVLAGAKGNYETEIKKILHSSLPKESYMEISFEENMPALYNCFDMFVHVPIDGVSEAFGQIYVEALAIGIPSIFTLSGIAHEFIKDRHNALVVPYQSSEAIYRAMHELCINNEIVQKITAQGRVDALQFDLPVMINGLENLYGKH